jgi:hypothetical protein
MSFVAKSLAKAALAATISVIHLRRHGADPATPLASYFSEHRWCPIDVLKLATTTLGSAYSFTRADISARSGAMAPSSALPVDGNQIKCLRQGRTVHAGP